MKVKDLKKEIWGMDDNDEVVIKDRNGSIIGVKSVEETHTRVNYDYIETFGWYTQHRCVIEADTY